MAHMSRILVAVSSPWAAEKVAEPLAGLALQLNAEVLAVHVSRPSGGQMREQEQADGEAAVRLLNDRLASRNVAVQTLLMFSDDIARAILNTAVERQITLIVLVSQAKCLREIAGGQCAGGIDQEHADSRAAPPAGIQRIDLGFCLPDAPNQPQADQAACCIVGGGPAGVMAGFLLARAGVDVLVLEKHKDFFRDFRGDTIHPSTLQLMHELGLLDEFLKQPHEEFARDSSSFRRDGVPLR